LNIRIKLSVSLCLPLLLLLNSCFLVKKNALNEIERKVVIGRAVHSDSTDAADAIVSLFDVRIIDQHDSILKTYSTTTSRNGYFILQGVPDGQYLLYIYDVSRGKCDLSCVKKMQTSLQLGEPVVLKSLVTLKGRVISTEKVDWIKIIVPGFGAATKPDVNGWYVLSDVPAGNYELAFVRGKSVEYLHVNITDDIKDTVLIRDFYFGYQSSSFSSAYEHCLYPEVYRSENWILMRNP